MQSRGAGTVAIGVADAGETPGVVAQPARARGTASRVLCAATATPRTGNAAVRHRTRARAARGRCLALRPQSDRPLTPYRASPAAVPDDVTTTPPHVLQRTPFALFESGGGVGVESGFTREWMMHETDEAQAPRRLGGDVRHRAERQAVDEHGRSGPEAPRAPRARVPGPLASDGES